MSAIEVPRLPRRVRLAHREDPESYLQRLLAHNELSSRYLRRWEGAFSRLQLIAALAGIDETKLATPRPAHLVDGAECDACANVVRGRRTCHRCVLGAEAPAVPHGEENVCLRHRMWLGIGAADPQIPIGREHITAERRFRRLRSIGKLTPVQLLQLITIVQRSRRAEGREESPAQAYPVAVKLACLITGPAVSSWLFDPRNTFATAYESLRRELGVRLGETSPVLIDAVWLAVRPTFAAIRALLDGRQFAAEHLFAAPSLLPQVIRPLEPLPRYFDQLRTCAVNLVEDRSMRYRMGWLGDGLDQSICSANRRATLCEEGHAYIRTEFGFIESVGVGKTGCGICRGKVVLPGFNGMAQTHPWMVELWAFDLNGDVDPSRINAGQARPCWWRCREGHVWQQPPSRLRVSNGCQQCSGRIPTPGVNSLDVRYPHLLEQWDPELNDASLGDHKAASRHVAWWRCRCGRAWRASIHSRTQQGSGCPSCRYLPGGQGTDLASLSPDLAAEWHPTGNRKSPSEVPADSTGPYWWLCSRCGHEYKRSPRARMANSPCPVCSGKLLRTGLNDLATRYPEIVASYHPTLNPLPPDKVRALANLKYVWICELGHSYASFVSRRLQGHACPYCANWAVLRGFNDAATLEPIITEEWDTERNGVGPGDVLRGDTQWWWRCAHRHRVQATVRTRRSTGGCTSCPQHERILSR